MSEVLDRFRSSTWGWLRGTLLGWLTLLLCLVGVGFLIILIQWIRFLDATYELTEDRLILRKGIFVKVSTRSNCTASRTCGWISP